ncbi:riboflavin biosynthesis protein RibF [Phycisphaera mikurensis]|uniref:Riboflavin biosynthesis protein n=1 Tax=Phycisphaera mikurensis (strain NBRC 102666 / KCTC 22515 / FYK2301M01) TaxID=1142394 RepID=I0IG47_PHYMF|nr:riboflavin biosynthesis protein RibF [Phycisphaera mikurensis]MBB6440382.1 riboflavin kinase/FMN adenylyltransferase [Phycisphaera mikurensis]BAM04235.1 riboflavin kinase/FMN adenylyltransferase [Phycisphaera mikurensis NBRC 102666]
MRRTVLSLGNFDGVHLGHQALLRTCRRHAEAAGAGVDVVAVTFDPPPVRVLRPDAEPLRIDTLQDRVRRLRHAGADRVEVLVPTPELLAEEAEGFIAGLVGRFHPVAIVEGPDFRFGRGRRGDLALLAALGRDAGFEAVRLDRTHARLASGESVAVSSSRIRALVAEGRVADAACCLGRPLERVARVVRGEQRGRTIGFPTLNLDPADLDGCVLPAEGVYAARVAVSGDTQRRDLPAAVSIGTKPTFDGTVLTVEAHLIGFSGDLYGAQVRVGFVRCLRAQRRYEGVDALRVALAADVEAAAEILAERPLEATPR